jgi:hypothetical protein
VQFKARPRFAASGQPEKVTGRGMSWTKTSGRFTFGPVTGRGEASAAARLAMRFHDGIPSADRACELTRGLSPFGSSK